MSDGPYRASDVREGVALPRRGVFAWHVAALAPLIVAAPFALASAPSSFALAAAVALASIGIGTGAVVSGRSRRGALLLLAPLALVGAVEAWAWTTSRACPTDMAAALATVARARAAAYASSAALAVVAAVACAGAVFSIDPRRLRASEGASWWAGALGLAIAATLVVARMRSVHREGLVGALSIGLVVAAVVTGGLLARRIGALASWHDAAEARAAGRAAVAAIAALALTAACLERALLARDEAAALVALASRGGFDVRLEHAEALASAWAWHPAAALAAAAAALVGVAPILAARRALPRSGRAVDGGVAAAAFAIVASLVAVTADAERAALVPPRPEIRAVALPSAPTLAPARPYGREVAIAADGSFAPPDEPSGHVFVVFAAHRRAPTRSVLAALEAYRGGCTAALLFEGASVTSLVNLGRAGALVGDRLVTLPVAVSETPPDGDGDVLLVIADGDVGRVAVRRGARVGLVEGVGFRTDPEARARRRALASARAGVLRAIVAPDPTRDAQALADLLAAVRDVAPDATLVLTPGRDVLERAFVSGR